MEYDALAEVTKDEFYEIIFNNLLNVHPRVVADGSDFEFPNRTLFGRVVGVDGHYWDSKHKYFVVKR